MKPLPLLICLLLMHPHGAGATGFSPADDAFAAGLWEVAALRYEARLDSLELEAAEKQSVALRLAESWIRGGESFKALELLDLSWIEASPLRDFWRTQALAGSGRFAEAVEGFRLLLSGPDFPHRQESAFTCANLQLSLGQPDEALATLGAFREGATESTAAAADIKRVAIFLDLGRLDEARAALPDPEQIAPADQPFAALLKARLLLAEGNGVAAASAFAALMDQPQGQSLTDYHAAALGFADSLAAQNSIETASTSLLSFIQLHPDSPLLDAVFKRLLEWMPQSPSLSDPVLDRLAQWIPPATIPVTGLIAPGDSAAPAWPPSTTANDLTTFAIFTRAVGLHRVGTLASRAEAKRLLTRLLFENPGHFLASRALLQMGRWHLEEGRMEQAKHLLLTVRETAKSPRLRGEAAFLQASAAFHSDDAENAGALFDEASADLDAQTATSARFNAAISRLKSSGVTLIQQENDAPDDPTLTADLMLERALSMPSPNEARIAIEEFLTSHPGHRRVAEARLAAAEMALQSSPPDASFARAQLETLESSPDLTALLPAERLALAKLRVTDLAGDATMTIAQARVLLETWQGGSVAAEASLILGHQLFQSGSYNDARLVFERLAAGDADTDRAQAAWLLAARSAALSATAQSREEALGLFDKAIAIDGPVKSIAILEKARLMIDLSRLEDAVVFLREWMTSLPDGDALRLPAGFMLGEAIYARGAANPTSLEEALAIYEDLLVQANEQPALLYRLQYRRGMTLEQLPMPSDPTRKREAEALDAYYSVFEIAGDKPPAEWEWFENCGFRALGILENAQRWQAAIAVARKIASFKGPRAAEAATRASQLQLKHMIWED